MDTTTLAALLATERFTHGVTERMVLSVTETGIRSTFLKKSKALQTSSRSSAEMIILFAWIRMESSTLLVPIVMVS